MSAVPMKLEHGLLIAITVTLLTLTAGAVQYARASGPCSEGGCPTCQNDECALTSCEVDEQTGNVTKCIYDCLESCGGGGGGGGPVEPGG